jgi:hypothetical protein
VVFLVVERRGKCVKVVTEKTVRSVIVWILKNFFGVFLVL